MGVVPRRQPEMAEALIGIPRLLHGAQGNRAHNAFFRPPGNPLQNLLHIHGPDLSLLIGMNMQPEGAQKAVQPFNLFRVWLLMDAVNKGKLLFFHVPGHRLIG